MKDMLVHLYNLDFADKMPSKDVKIVRVLSPDSDKVIAFVETHFSKGWAAEVKAAVYQSHPTCFVALHENKIVGFSAYNATSKGYFGPIGVDLTLRNKKYRKGINLTYIRSNVSRWLWLRSNW